MPRFYVAREKFKEFFVDQFPCSVKEIVFLENLSGLDARTERTLAMTEVMEEIASELRSSQ